MRAYILVKNKNERGEILQEKKVVAALVNREEWAIDYLLSKYSKLLWSVVYPILHKVAAEEDMEECIADVFIYLWQNPTKYDLARGKLKNFLVLLARSRAVDRYREVSRVSNCALEESVLGKEADLAEGMIYQETLERLKEALMQIKETEREILLRRYYYEQKPREIALALDIPAKQVDNCLYRSKIKLRKLLEEKEGEIK